MLNADYAEVEVKAAAGILEATSNKIDEELRLRRLGFKKLGEIAVGYYFKIVGSKGYISTHLYRAMRWEVSKSRANKEIGVKLTKILSLQTGRLTQLENYTWVLPYELTEEEAMLQIPYTC